MCLQVLGKTSAQAESTATGHGKARMWSLRRKPKKEDTLKSVSSFLVREAGLEPARP